MKGEFDSVFRIGFFWIFSDHQFLDPTILYDSLGLVWINIILGPGPSAVAPTFLAGMTHNKLFLYITVVII